MAKVFSVIEIKKTELVAKVATMGLVDDGFDLYFYHKPGVGTMAILAAFNTAPVITDLSGTVAFNNNASEPDWSTGYMSVADAETGDTITTVIDASEVDMIVAGTFDVTWTVTDGWGASDTLVKTITITDVTVPVITDSIGATTFETGTAEPDWSIGVTALDETDGVITGDIVITDAAADMNTVGNFNILYNVDDAASNSAVQVTRVITIEDTTIPTITLAVDEDVNTEDAAAWTNSAAATDNLDGDLTASIVIAYFAADGTTPLSPDNLATARTALGAGTNVVITYNVDDANGNSAVEVTITLTAIDNTVPVITASNANVNTEDASAWDNSATAADNKDGVITGDIVITYFKADGTTPLADLAALRTDLYAGLNVKVNYNVDDAAANSAVEKVITLTAVDNTLPVITAESEIIDVSETAAWVDSATALDNKDGAITPVVTTYFEADNTTPIANIATFRTYINNSGAGETGYVHYNVDDAASNSATEVEISVTATVA